MPEKLLDRAGTGPQRGGSVLVDRGRTLPATVFYPLVLVPAVGSLALTGGAAEIQILALLYLTVLGVALARPIVAVGAVLVIMLWSLLQSGLPMTAAGMDVRIGAAPFIGILAVRALATTLRNRRSAGGGIQAGHLDRPAGRAGPGRHTPTGSTFAVFPHLLCLALPALAVFGLASVTWSIDPEKSRDAVLALVLVSVFVVSARVVPIGQLLRTLAALGWLIIAASLVLLVLAPELAVAGGRVRGIFQNTNGLAVFLVLFTPVIVTRLDRLRWPVAILLLALCVSTASRAGSAAVILGLAIVLMDRSTRSRLSMLALTGAATAWLAAQALRADATDPPILLLRRNDSRSELWQEGLRYFESNRYLGVGLGALPEHATGGLVPQLLGAGGLVGGAIGLAALVALLFAAVGGRPMYRALVLGGVLNVMFEPWLLSAGSMYCAVFWLLACHPGVLRHVRTVPGTAVPGSADGGTSQVSPASAPERYAARMVGV